MPFSSSLWMAAGLLWILDAGNNTAMEPYRAFIADKLPRVQYAKGFMTQSFFTGLGITLANLSLYFFQQIWTGESGSGIPFWVFGAFFVGAFCYITSVLWSVYTTPEIAPDHEEIAHIKAANAGQPHPILQFFFSILTTVIAYAGILILLIPNLFIPNLLNKFIHYLKTNELTRTLFASNIEIIEAIIDMPSTLWQLALVYLFQWYAMFVYWQYISHSIAQSVWKTSAEVDKALYGQAAGWSGLVNGFYNIVTFLSAFGLVWITKKFKPKYVHAVCLLMASFALFTLPHITNKYLLFAPMIGFGVGWASMMGIPYIMVANSIPKEKNGIYMGIVNMMIVIPMIIQTLTFGYVYKNILGSNPGHALMFGGLLLLFAALATLRIQVKED